MASALLPVKSVRTYRYLSRFLLHMATVVEIESEASSSGRNLARDVKEDQPHSPDSESDLSSDTSGKVFDSKSSHGCAVARYVISAYRASHHSHVTPIRQFYHTIIIIMLIWMISGS